MKEVTLKVFEFSELSEEVQQKLIRKRSEFNQARLDTNFITETLRENLISNGVKAKHVYWSLSNCQGDGVCIDGIVDAVQLFKFMGVRNKTINDLAAKGELKVVASHEGRYSHKYSFKLEIIFDDQDQPKEVVEYANKLTESALEHIRNACSEAEKVGYEHIEHLSSEEVAKDELLNDEQLYFSDGRYFDETIAS